MKQTIADVLGFVGGKGVLFLRHAKYELRHAIATCAGSELVAIANNYSRRFPDSFFPLNDEGIRNSKLQGARMVELGVRPVEIKTSQNGRGPHTAICINQGIAGADGQFVQLRYSEAVDYPIYDYETLASVMREINNVGGSNNVMVAQWLNGERPGLCQETPENFHHRTTRMVEQLVRRGQFILVVGHCEMITLLHALYVAQESMGSISQNWEPTYNQGVLVMQAPGRLIGFDVNPDLTMSKSVSPGVLPG